MTSQLVALGSAKSFRFFLSFFPPFFALLWFVLCLRLEKWWLLLRILWPNEMNINVFLWHNRWYGLASVQLYSFLFLSSILCLFPIWLASPSTYHSITPLQLPVFGDFYCRTFMEVLFYYGTNFGGETKRIFSVAWFFCLIHLCEVCCIKCKLW